MKIDVRKYCTESRRVTKSIFVGPYDEGVAVMDELHKNGWRITRSGPYTDKKMFPKMDMTRFLFHAEQ